MYEVKVRQEMRVSEIIMMGKIEEVREGLWLKEEVKAREKE